MGRRPRQRTAGRSHGRGQGAAIAGFHRPTWRRSMGSRCAPGERGDGEAAELTSISLLLLCLLGSLFKPSRRQAVASSPVVEPRFLVALQTAIHVAANPL